MNTPCEFDHLIVGAHTLEQGAAFIEDLLGVKPQAGGRHAMMGTHNMVLRLGARAYLEVIAIDPAGESPQRPRWFGLDDKKVQKQLRDWPRLLTWAVRTQNIDAAVKNCPLALGTVHQISRGDFTWRITIPDDGALICDGLVPAVIQWDCDAHPADRMEERGYELVKLAGYSSAPGNIAPAFAALGIESTISLAGNAGHKLIAALRGSNGVHTVTS